MSGFLYNYKYAKVMSFWLSFMHINALVNKKLIGALRPSTDDVILEIGCSRGETVSFVRQFSRSTVGIDINKEAVENAVVPGICSMDAINLNFPDGHFDKIYSLQTIEHIRDLRRAFLEMERVLKAEGTIVLSYPFELVRGISCLGTALFVHKNILAAREMHLHKLDRKKVEELIRGTKLRIKEHSLCLLPLPVFLTTLVKTA